ncbi:MAG TPA: hypothetical protein VKA30_07500 [Actinomycetota bacterium]|nr:hypothetical protein [Actinomycetota bacterium]
MPEQPAPRPRRRLVAPLIVAALVASGCGLRVDASTPEYRSFFASKVSASGSNLAGGGFAHGGIAPAGSETKPPPARLKPGEVYLGTTPLRVALPKPGRVVASVTYPQWAALFLPRIGAPVCGNNLVAMVAWQAQEGTRAAWNPLATTHGMPGATTFNSVGVRNYSSLEEGIQATVLTLLAGRETFGYGPVVQGLRACAPPLWTAQAIQASLWCHNCAGGHYLTALVPAVIADFNRAFAPRSNRS